jgi:stress-induced morphogen
MLHKSMRKFDRSTAQIAAFPDLALSLLAIYLKPTSICGLEALAGASPPFSCRQNLHGPPNKSPLGRPLMLLAHARDAFACALGSGNSGNIALSSSKRIFPMAMTAPEIEKFIKDALPDALIEIKDLAGDGNHYAATVASAAFKGKNRVQQHQMVYAALKGNMGGVLHALALTTTILEN